MHERTIILSMMAMVVATAPAVAGPGHQKPQQDSWSWSFSSGRGRLGMATIQISPELRQHLGAPSDRGVLIDSVRPDSPAAKAGIKVGDVVTDVDGAAATSASEVLDALSDRNKGDHVDIVVDRDGKRLQLQATLDDDAADVPSFDWRTMMKQLGPADLGDFQRRLDELDRRLQKLERT